MCTFLFFQPVHTGSGTASGQEGQCQPQTLARPCREAPAVLAPVPASERVTVGHSGRWQPEAAEHQVGRGILFAFLGEQESDWAAASGRPVCACGCGMLRAVLPTSSKHVSQNQPASSAGPCAGAAGLSAASWGIQQRLCLHTDRTLTPHPTSSLLLEPASPPERGRGTRCAHCLLVLGLCPRL